MKNLSGKSENWEILSKESLLSRKPWFEVHQESVRLPNGKLVQDYYGIQMPHYTVVFAMTEEQKVLVLRCYGHAIGEVTLTMPGGMLETGEDPLEGIQRELLEETGYVAPQWKMLGSFAGSSTRGCGTYHMFFATEAYSKQEADSGDLEEMELLLWTPKQIEEAIDTGKVQSLGVISMLLLGLRHSKY